MMISADKPISLQLQEYLRRLRHEVEFVDVRGISQVTVPQLPVPATRPA